MKHYTEQEIKQFISEGKITYVQDGLELDDSCINKDILIASLKKLQTNSKDKIDKVEQEDFNEYRKQSQKNRNKIRKCK